MTQNFSMLELPWSIAAPLQTSPDFMKPFH